jgi:hypothetical protein
MVKRSITILMTCLGLLPTLHAQDAAVQQGNVMLSGGPGFVSLEGVAQTFITNVISLKSTYTDLTTTASIPILVKGEYMISDYIGLGLNVNYSTFKASFKVDKIYNGSVEMTRSSIILRTNGHLGKLISDDNKSWDPFIGLGLGYQNILLNYTDNQTLTPDPSFTVPFPVTFEATAGIRYFMIPNVGAYLELGVSRAFVQVGITAKF